MIPVDIFFIISDNQISYFYMKLIILGYEAYRDVLLRNSNKMYIYTTCKKFTEIEIWGLNKSRSMSQSKTWFRKSYQKLSNIVEIQICNNQKTVLH